MATSRRWQVALFVLTLAVAACEKRIDPIVVEHGLLIVNNKTATAWSNVEIWLNDHYRVTVPRIEAGGRFTVRLENFSAAFARRFDPKRQSVTGVELRAQGADAAAVRITWGAGRRW